MFFTRNNNSHKTSLIQIYKQKCQSESLKYDAEQVKILAELENISSDLSSNSFFKRKTKTQGLYIYGSVGSGKSMLVDVFFHNIDIRKKRKVHFHKFMQEVHDEMHKLKNKESKNLKSKLERVAAKISKENQLLCFDEFQVSDVADALILGQLFAKIFANGTYITVTSNRHPDDLYLGGIQREKFLEFVFLFKEKLMIKPLISAEDYREIKAKEINRRYFYPIDPSNQKLFNQLFKELTENSTALSQELTYKKHKIFLELAVSNICWIDFSRFFSANYAASDYQFIADKYKIIFIDNLNEINPENSDIAKRFINFIDVIYENQVTIFMLSNVKVTELYQGSKLKFEFKRSLSRIYELTGS